MRKDLPRRSALCTCCSPVVVHVIRQSQHAGTVAQEQAVHPAMRSVSRVAHITCRYVHGRVPPPCVHPTHVHTGVPPSRVHALKVEVPGELQLVQTSGLYPHLRIK